MVKDTIWELVIIGGGPAGMAAAVTAKEMGLNHVLLLDRNAFLGGVLPQCIHDGFGLFEFGVSLTGPEYAEKWIKRLKELNVHSAVNATVLNIQGDGPFILSVIEPKRGFYKIHARSVIIACGCREKTLGQLRIPGSRPAGIYTAGAAQYMINVQNYLPGKSVVILGLGDIGLIMARRLKLENTRVKLILGDRAGGLLRNYIQCIKDFNIPIKLGYTVVSTHGYQRLKGVTVAPLSTSGEIIFEKKEYIPCDTLLIATGLIPETELWRCHDTFLNDEKGIPVNTDMATPKEGIFACGNVVRISDTADEVSEMGRIAGEAAVRWIHNNKIKREKRTKRIFLRGRRLKAEDMNSLEERLICTFCPRGCYITVIQENGDSIIKGNGCLKGKEFVFKEMKLPERVVTTTVRIQEGDRELLPVKTDLPIPKDQIPEVMRICRKVLVQAPVLVGTVIVDKIAHTHANLVATGSVLKKKYDGEY